MTKLLERAVERVKSLPEREQDVIATLIFEELEEEASWDQGFARSEDTLSKLAADAMREHRAGKTQELDPDKL
jgi:hypothetical protein